MAKFPFILSLFTFPGIILAQAELDKVRDMFSPMDENMEVSIWKGHFHDNHPVELFLAQRDDEIKGYYRLISSGEEYILEGEFTEKEIILVEYKENEELGIITMNNLPEYTDNAILQATWQNNLRTDAINMEVKAARYSDYTSNSFQPQVQKYCNYNNKTSTCITLELLDKQRVVFSKSDELQKRVLTRDSISKNLAFDITVNDQLEEYQVINGTLRKLVDGQFSYYELQNSIQFKRINYASSALIMDVEYPALKSESFNDFISDIVSEKRKALRREIQEIGKSEDLHPSVNHFQFKWQGWTEIDYLGTSLISGRLISIISRGSKTEMEVTPFNYDLVDEKNLNIKREFKSDFSFESYLSKYIHAELPQLKIEKSVNPQVNESDFKHLTFADNYLLVSTDYDWIYGESVLRIPHSSMRSLVKRSSILKTLMKN